jgi:hypothetical protein
MKILMTQGQAGCSTWSLLLQKASHWRSWCWHGALHAWLEKLQTHEGFASAS